MTALMLAACGQSADETPTSSAEQAAFGGTTASVVARAHPLRRSGGGMESCSPGYGQLLRRPGRNPRRRYLQGGYENLPPSGQGYGPARTKVPATEKCDTEADEDCTARDA